NIATVAGSGLPVDGSLATAQPIDFPTAAISDNNGGFFVVSTTQNKVYRVAGDGTLTIVAGAGDYGFSGDGGPASSAHLASPNGIALDANGNLYIADTYNNRVRKVTHAGIISTLAAGLSPYGVYGDSSGNVLIAEPGRIRKVSADGTIGTVF